VSALVTSNQSNTLAEAPQIRTKRKSPSPAKSTASKPIPHKNDNRCRHLASQFQPSDQDLSPAFAGQLSGFRSALDIHIFLAHLTILLVQNRISTRRAAVLTYLGQTLLRTTPAVQDGLDAHEQSTPWIFDLPRPKRD